jgi:MFS family permease
VGGLPVTGLGFGIAIRLDEYKTGGVIRLLQDIETGDSLLLDAVTGVLQRGRAECVDELGPDVYVDLKNQHSSTHDRTIEGQCEAHKLEAYSAFRSRDYRLVLVALGLSNFGMQMLSVAVSWDLYIQTKSPLVLGNVGFVQVAPFLLFALFAGHVADRYDRRRTMVLTQILQLAASVLLLAGSRSVLVIYSCLFLSACARAFQWPARQALLPHIVPTEALGNAITWNSSVQEISSVSGPAIAGILLAATGSRTVYQIQVICAALTLVCFMAVRYRSKPLVNPTAPDAKSLLEGMHFVFQNKLILAAISLDLFAVLFGGAVALLPIYAADILHAGASGLGWLRAAPSVGSVTMALVTAHMPRIRRAGTALLWSVAGFGAATIVFGISRSFWLSIAMLVLVGAFDNVSVVLRQSLIQTKTPDYVRGRVLAFSSIFISSSNQFGAVESGWTAAWFGAVPSVAGGGAATIAVVAICAALSRQLRTWKQ